MDEDNPGWKPSSQATANNGTTIGPRVKCRITIPGFFQNTRQINALRK